MSHPRGMEICCCRNCLAKNIGEALIMVYNLSTLWHVADCDTSSLNICFLIFIFFEFSLSHYALMKTEERGDISISLTELTVWIWPVLGSYSSIVWKLLSKRVRIFRQDRHFCIDLLDKYLFLLPTKYIFPPMASEENFLRLKPFRFTKVQAVLWYISKLCRYPELLRPPQKNYIVQIYKSWISFLRRLQRGLHPTAYSKKSKNFGPRKFNCTDTGMTAFSVEQWAIEWWNTTWLTYIIYGHKQLR